MLSEAIVHSSKSFQILLTKHPIEVSLNLLKGTNIFKVTNVKNNIPFSISVSTSTSSPFLLLFLVLF